MLIEHQDFFFCELATPNLISILKLGYFSFTYWFIEALYILFIVTIYNQIKRIMSKYFSISIQIIISIILNINVILYTNISSIFTYFQCIFRFIFV